MTFSGLGNSFLTSPPDYLCANPICGIPRPINGCSRSIRGLPRRPVNGFFLQTSQRLLETNQRISAPRSGRMTKRAQIFTENCIRTKFAHTKTTHANFQEKQMEIHIPGMSRTRKPPETLQDTIKKHEKTRHRNDSELRTRRNPCAGTLPVTTDNPTGPDQTDAPTYNHAPLCFYRLRCQDHIR